MNADGTSAAPPAGASQPPLEHARRRHPWTWLAAIAIAVLAIAAVARGYHRFPSDEERKYFGWWYGLESLDDSNARGWIAEFRDDGSLHITFGRWHRVNAEKAWQFSSSEETGRWRVRDNLQQLASEDPARHVSWVERIQRFQETGSVRRLHSYRTTLINEHELRYVAVADGTAFRSLHSRVAVEMPSEPLPPEQWSVAPGSAGTAPR